MWTILYNVNKKHTHIYPTICKIVYEAISFVRLLNIFALYIVISISYFALTVI